MKNDALIVERILDAPAERVWKAFTNSDEMKKWYFDIPAFKAEPGFKFSFVGGNKEETMVFVHQCEVKEVVPNRKLSFSWQYEGYPGYSLVSFELFPEADGKTRMRITHEGLSSFPDVKDFARDNFEKGWTHILGTSLAEFVKK